MFKVIDDDIYITRGDTMIFHIGITFEDGTDYTMQPGDELIFTVRKSPKSEDVLIQKTGREIILNPEDTEELDFRDYCYDVQLTTADGIVDTIITPSIFSVLQEVTY